MGTIYFLAFITVFATLRGTEGRNIGWNSRNGMDMDTFSKENFFSSHGSSSKELQKMMWNEINEESDISPNLELYLSAWEIIGIIVGAVVFVTLAYYAFLLYPYICKKENPYHNLEDGKLRGANITSTVPIMRHNR